MARKAANPDMAMKPRERFRTWLADETGTIRKPWGGRWRIALAFPNRYALAMSNLGFQTVYARLNEIPGLVCERVFFPEPEDLDRAEPETVALVSIESRHPLRDFDLVAFSISFENDFENAVKMLHLAAIALRSEARRPTDPWIAAGGVAVFLNPEPLAPFMDFFFIGEAEPLLPDFRLALESLQGSTLPRLEQLRHLARACPGLYVPSLYQVRYRADGTLAAVEPEPGVPYPIPARKAALSNAPVCHSSILTPNAEFSQVSLLEIGRGCGRSCRFCAAGYVYRPPRNVTAGKLLATAAACLDHSDRLGLVSAAVSDHPEITRICEELTDLGAALSFSSIRADTLNPAVIRALASGRHRAIAIAPEAGSERLRRVINKHLTQDQILVAAEQLAAAGILNLKLYLMIGLPTETLDDLEAMIDLVKKVRHHVLLKSRGRRRMGTITLSLNSFVPKPFTPFQWVPFAGVQTLKERARWIKKALGKVANVRVHFDLPKWAYLQALLSRGDRRTADFLEAVAGGRSSWVQALKSSPHNPDFWVLRERQSDERFPWEIIDHGISRQFLWEEYERALEARESPVCLPATGCRRCGVCRP